MRRGRAPQIVAYGGGGFSMEPGNPLLDDYVLSLCRRKRPRVCFFASASGDADHYVVRFYRHFHSGVCEPSHVSLFRRDCGPGKVREHLLNQDLVYVGGGSILSLLGVWRAHGIDEDLRAAWRAGVILCGVSAGSLCWFASGLTAYHHDARPYTGLGFLPHSNAVHYEQEDNRRPAYHAALLDGSLPAGYAASDGAALHFVGDDLHRVVLSRETARAYRVEAAGGEVAERPLAADYLGERPPIALVA
jgi:dipeptidase E